MSARILEGKTFAAQLREEAGRRAVGRDGAIEKSRTDVRIPSGVRLT